MSYYKNMFIVVTARCHDEFDTQLRLQLPEQYNLEDDLGDPEAHKIFQNVADFFENKGITIDQGGDENNYEFDLPDTFDNASSAQRTATKVLKRLQTKLERYKIIPPSAPVQTQQSQTPKCWSMTKEERLQNLQDLLDTGEISQEIFEVLLERDKEYHKDQETQ